MLPSVDQLSVVLIDDDPDHLERLSCALRSTRGAPKQVHTFSDPAEAIAHLPAERPLAIVCDYHTPDGTDVEWISELLRPGAGPVITVTDHGNERVAAEAFRMGAADYLVEKDILAKPDILVNSIRCALRRYHLDESIRQLTHKLKIANHNLQQSNAKLSEMTTTAHRFVDNVAHEFRTPLAVIQEFTSILQDGIGGPLNDQQREYLGYIALAVRDLGQMVDDFLDSSRLKARTLRVDRQAHDVAAIIEAVLPTTESRGQIKKMRIETRIEPQMNQAFCDRKKVERVLINLAVNAIKFSSEGQTVLLWADTDESGGIRLGVTDHGPGLSQEEIEHLGERFRQAGDPQVGTNKGFGLGLSIARELVTLNLGRMQIESKPGEGSTFWFTLPTCEPSDVLRRFVSIMEEQCPASALSLLRATPRVPGPIEPVRAGLAMLSYPMDLILPTVDRTAVLLVGASNEPDKWIERISEDYARAAALRKQDAASDALPPIDLTWLQTWKPNGHRKHLADQVCDALVGLPRCS